MMEYFYYMAYETEMLNGEIKRAHHFLEKLATGKGFYSEVAKVLLYGLDNKVEPEELEGKIMSIQGDEPEKRAIYLKFLYSFNRYDVNYPYYDSKRCNDA